MAVKTFTTGEVLTAADTNTYLNNGGLVYVNTTTFSGVTTFNSAASTFTSTYTNYRLIVTLSNSTASYDGLFLRMRTGTTTNANANYGWGGLLWGSNLAVASNNTGAAAATSFGLGTNGEIGYPTSMIIEVYKPQATDYTHYQVNVTRVGSGATVMIGYLYNGGMTVNTSYDAFTILTGGGQITGNVVTYGYRIG